MEQEELAMVSDGFYIREAVTLNIQVPEDFDPYATLWQRKRETKLSSKIAELRNPVKFTPAGSVSKSQNSLPEATRKLFVKLPFSDKAKV